jgi:hypothetical protein
MQLGSIIAYTVANMVVFFVKEQYSPLWFYTYTLSLLVNAISLLILILTLCSLCDIQIRHEAQEHLETVSLETYSVQDSSVLGSYRVMGNVGD